MKRTFLNLIVVLGLVGAASAQDYIGPAATPAKPKAAPPAAAQKPAPAPVAQSQQPAPAANAQQPQQPKIDVNENHGDWVLQCWKQETRVCQILQREVEAKSQKTILITTISATPDKGYRLMMLTPLGLKAVQSLPVTVDNAPFVELPMQACIASGCVHVMELTAPLLAKLQSAGDISLTLTALNGQKLGLRVPVKGLKDALGKMSQYLKT
jgi:invasion protein IalB